MSQGKTLLIIDSHALLYRAYYAMPPTLTTSEGEPINAVYGFASLVLDVLLKFKPDHCLAVMDSRGPTIRHQEYSFYKANRKETDELFIQQMPRAEEVISNFDIPLLKLEGVEADDIIGTIVNKFHAEFEQVIIVTGDQDIFQLIQDNIYVFMAGRKFSESKLYDREMVVDKLNITPEQVIDYKGLCGDPSDNIPGVTGIGKKGAATLINEFGSIENIYTRIEEVANRYKNKLIENHEMAMLSKSLATIKTDIPISFDIEDTLLSIDNSVKDIIEELQFNTLKNKAQKLLEAYHVEVDTVDNQPPVFEEIISNLKESDNLVGNVFVLTNLVEDQDPLEYKVEELLIMDSKESVYRVGESQLSIFLAKLAELAISIVTFDSKKIVHVLQNHFGDELVDFEIIDVGIYAMLMSEGGVSYNLESISQRYADGSVSVSALKEIYQLVAMSDKLDEQQEKLAKIEHELVNIVVSMERNGVELDTDKTHEFMTVLSSKLENLQLAIYESSGEEFNIKPPKQVSQILFETLKLPPTKKTKSGSYTTNESALKKIAHEHRIVKQILIYREIDKLLSTYVKALPGYINESTGKIHATFEPMGTVSGRFSSRNPNLQNIPKGETQGVSMREAFVARDGYAMISLDYSQQELRILAALSGEQVMIDSYNNGDDIHAMTAAEIFEIDIKNVTKDQRSVGKLVNFSVIYGISSYGLADSLEVSQSEAAMFINKYFITYPRVKEFFDEQVEHIKRVGYAQTVMGRRRQNDLLISKNKALQNAGRRELLNFIIQGSAADIMKLAMSKLPPILVKHNALLVAQIHDEFLFELPTSQIQENFVKDVSTMMKNVYDIGVAYEVEASAGSSWGSLSILK